MKAEFSDDVRETMAQVLSAGGFVTPEAAVWEISHCIPGQGQPVRTGMSELPSQV